MSARGIMIMNFITNDEIEGTRWSVEYTVGGCGGYSKGRNGEIDAYAHNLDGIISQQVNCTWILETEDSSKVVQLKERNYFKIKHLLDSHNV